MQAETASLRVVHLAEQEASEKTMVCEWRQAKKKSTTCFRSVAAHLVELLVSVRPLGREGEDV